MGNYKKLFSVFIILFCQIAVASQKLVCVSWMGLKTQVKEADLSEYALAHIQIDQGDWAYEADVVEGNINYVSLFYKPLNLNAVARSSAFPSSNIRADLVVGDTKANVDCDIR